MKEITFTVTDPLGIHARPAGDDEEACAAAIEKFLKENF